MTTEDKTVAVRLIGYNDEFKKMTSESGGLIKQLEDRITGSFRNIGSTSTAESERAATGLGRIPPQMAAIGAGAALLGAGMLAVGVKMASTFESVGAEVLKIQRFTGLSAEASSQLRFEAEETGVSIDTLTRSLGLMSKKMDTSPATFEKMGIAVKDSNGQLRSSSDVLLDVADKVKNASTATERLAIVQEAFGRGGQAMLVMMMQGRDGLQKLGEEAQKYGLVLTQDNLGAVQNAIMAHREFNAAIQGVQVQIGEKFLPVLTSLTHVFTELVAGTGGALGSILEYGGGALLAGGSALVLVGSLGKLKDAFMEMRSVSAITADIGLGPVAAMIAIGIAAEEVISKIAGIGNASYRAVGSVQDLTDAMHTLAETGKVTDTLAVSMEGVAEASKHNHFWTDLWNDDLWKQVGIVATGLTGQWYATAGLLHDVGNQSAAASKQIDKFHDSIMATASKDGIPAATRVIDAYESSLISGGMSASDAAAATRGWRDEVYKSVPPVVSLSQAEADLAVSTNDAAAAAKRANDALHATLDPLFAITNSAQKQADAQRTVTDATIAQFYATQKLDEAMRSGSPEARRQATDALAAANSTLSSANSGLITSTEDVETSFNTLAGALRTNPTLLEEAKLKMDEWAYSGHISTEQAAEFKMELMYAAAQANGLDRSVTLQMFIVGQEELQRAADNAAHLVASALIAFNLFGGVPHARGGPVSAGVMYPVAEEGPELFQSNTGYTQLLTGPMFAPQDSGHIFTASQTKQMLSGGPRQPQMFAGSSGGGGGTNTNNITINMPPGSNGEDVVNALRRYERLNGPVYASA